MSDEKTTLVKAVKRLELWQKKMKEAAAAAKKKKEEGGT